MYTIISHFHIQLKLDYQKWQVVEKELALHWVRVLHITCNSLLYLEHATRTEERPINAIVSCCHDNHKLPQVRTLQDSSTTILEHLEKYQTGNYIRKLVQY